MLWFGGDGGRLPPVRAVFALFAHSSPCCALSGLDAAPNGGYRACFWGAVGSAPRQQGARHLIEEPTWEPSGNPLGDLSPAAAL